MAGVQLTKHGHACVRLEHGDTTLVIDPGTFSGEVLGGHLDGVLVTHAHPDHLDRDALLAAAAADPDLQVWTNPEVAAALAELGDRVHAVRHGDRFTLGGLEVHVHGERHARTHLAPLANVGFLVGGEVFHPGDALTVPDEAVPTLLAPSNAPWLKSYEVVEYVQEVAPRRAFSVHDGLLNDIGLGIVDGVLKVAGDGLTGADVRRVPVGETVALP